jgi:hypothetical protein
LRITLAGNKNRFRGILVIFLALLVVAGLVWVNIQFSRNNPGGNDFLVHYVGTRSLLFEGISPYSEEVAQRIQTVAYGRPAQGIEHELRVAYPLYSVFLFAPFSLIGDYQLARAIWMVVLELALVAMCFLSLELLDWKPVIWIQTLVLIFSVLWYHAARGIINGNAVILIALMITGALLCIKNDRDQLAGILLALTTIKPHLVILFIPFILIWAIYLKRWKVITWFSISLAVLIIVSLIWMPDWILQNIWEILEYPGYNPAGTLAAALGEWFPEARNQLKWAIAILLGLVLVYEWVNSRKGKFKRFLWICMLTLVISQWIGIQTDPGNFILLFPALMMIIATLSIKWPRREGWIVSSVLVGLLVGLWILFIVTIQKSYQPIQNPVMFIPLPAFCLIGLYWIKWWVAGRHSSLWAEEL